MSISTDEQQWLDDFIENISVKELTEWENNFFEDMMKRYKEYGANMRLSPKQWQVLFKIAKKQQIDLP